MPQPATDNDIASADRVLQVLAALAQQGRAMTASELMAVTGLARSTLYRQLSRLKRWGFVMESASSYAPGPVSLQLALGFDLSSHLVHVARPILVQLSEQSHESVGLVIAMADQVICVDMVDSQQSLRCSFEKGRSVPLRAGASALCLLAHLPPVQRQAQMERLWPEPVARLERESALAKIREQGFVTTAGEVDPGVWGCSVPIYGRGEQVLAGLTLMAPISRVEQAEQQLIRLALVAGQRVSRELSRMG